MKTMTVMKKALLRMRSELFAGIAGNVKTQSDGTRGDIGDLYDLASTERDRELTLLLGDRDPLGPGPKDHPLKPAVHRFNHAKTAAANHVGLCVEIGDRFVKHAPATG